MTQTPQNTLQMSQEEFNAPELTPADCDDLELEEEQDVPNQLKRSHAVIDLDEEFHQEDEGCYVWEYGHWTTL